MIKRVSVPFFRQPHQSAVGFEASSSNCLEPHCQASGSGLQFLSNVALKVYFSPYVTQVKPLIFCFPFSAEVGTAH